MGHTKMRQNLDRRLAWLRLLIAIAVLLGMLGVTVARAQEGPIVTWSQTSLTGKTSTLYTPASGALFAQSGDGLARSDDAGETWREVPLPAKPIRAPDGKRPEAIVVDPTNHATIYLAADEGIYKTEDDATTWRLIGPADTRYSELKALAISPANPRILYLVETTSSGESVRFRRSTDGGETWTEPDPALDPPDRRVSMPCWWIITLLKPHPSDEHRLVRGITCSDRGMRVTVRESFDGGATWSPIHAQINGYPRWLVGQQGDAPGRLILGRNGDYRFGSYAIERSDDGGVTWTTLNEYQGGGVSPNPGLGIGALAMDPTSSDRLLLGVVADQRQQPAVPLRLSLDAGQTWLECAPEGLGRVHDVAFGIDGRLLFAATENGVWRAPAP